MRIRSKFFSAFGIVFIIIIIGGITSYVQIDRLLTAGERLGVIDARNVDAIMEAKLNVLHAHLLLEEVVAGQESTSAISTIEERINTAHWYLTAMLEGGSNEENTFFAVREEREKLREKIKEAENNIQDFHDIVNTRLNQFRRTGSESSSVDVRFDSSFNSLISAFDAVEELIKEDMELSENKMKSVAQAGLFSILISTGIGLLVAFIVALLVSGQFSKAIKKIADFAGNIASGDFTGKAEIHSKDELGGMADSLDSIVFSLGTMMKEVKDIGNKVNSTSLDLASNMEQTASSVNQISSHIESIKKVIINQASSVDESSASIEEVVRNIDSLNNQITNQSTSVNESSAAVEEMVSNIKSITQNIGKMEERFKDLQEAAGSGRQMLNKTSKTVQNISEQSQALLDTNKVISGIAAQTNLLAMNAAIEAAHAGDAGRGFAVVASEIRSLAEDTSKKSKDVDSFLKQLKQQIETMVDASKKSQDSFQTVEDNINTVAEISTEVKQSMEEQSSGSSQVLEALSEINSITEEVKNGSEEMKTGSQTVLEEMNRLSQNSTEAKESISEIVQGIDEINSSMQHISEITEQNKESASTLEDRMAQLKLSEDDAIGIEDKSAGGVSKEKTEPDDKNQSENAYEEPQDSAEESGENNEGRENEADADGKE